MAECSYARCVQERRAIKKELQRWTKNMVFVVGLERVAEELMGRRKWKQYQDLVLKTPLKVDIEPEIQDWEPQEKCCMCDGKAFLDSATSLVASESGSSGPNSPDSSSLRETPPVTLPHESSQSSAAPNNNVLPSLSSLASTSAAMTTLQSVTSMAASLAAVAALSSNSSHSNTGNVANNPMIPGVTTPPGAMPFYPPPPHHHGGLFPHWYLSPPQSHLTGRTLSPAAMSLAEGLRLEGITSTKQDHSTTPPIVMALPPSASAPEQPLDLSAKPVVCASGAGDSNARDSNSELASQATQQQSSQSLRVPSIDNKHIFKAKPRMSTVAGRRTYTEEELQAALRDIQSGKLGTRRAAVIYGIPRSTLRNKVYKLALERERDSHLVIGNNTSAPVTLVNVTDKSLEPDIISKVEDTVPEDDEKELSGAEEEREVEKALQKPLLSMEDLVRFSVLDAGKGIGSLLQQGRALEDGLRKHSVSGEEGETCTSPPVFPGFPQNITDIWNGMEHSNLGPYVSQLLATGIIGSKNPGGGTLEDRNTGSATAGNFLPKFPSPLLPEFVHRMIEEEKILIGEQLKKQHAAGIGNFKPNFHPNGAHASEESGADCEKLTLRHLGGVSSAKESIAEDSTNTDTFPPSSEATTSGMVTPPSNVILKIPSFKPTSKNGVASGSGGSGNTAESLFPVSQFQRSSSNPSAVATLHESSSQPFISPPVIGAARSGSESSSPPAIPPSLVGKGIGVSLRDMIVKSINQKFQHHGSNEVPTLHIPPKMLLGHESSIEPPFKRGRFTPPLCSSGPSITTSVIKHNNNSQSDDRHAQKMSTQLLNKPSSTSGGISSGGNQGNSTGGKGTRPKRGKYRNYDRDSLIEAVRAVQRGEMSVHRAGSHFGVPHSTLEYKVKERHLMRPRKREPKPQLEDPKKKDDIRQPLPNLDKTKIPPKTPKAPFTPASPGLPNAPNGLKLSPLFDPASMPPMAYAAAPPFPFWPPNPFHSLPIPDFPHSGAGNTQVGYSPTPEFFASQMMQRLQEGSSRVHAGGGGRANSPSGTPTCSRSPPVTNAGGTLGKSAREMAESLYDGTGANGSFLDGIIRSSLEMGLPHGASKDSSNTNAPENLSNKALLDQLCRNSRLTPLPRATSLPVNDGGASSSDDDSLKRSSSRNAFVPGSIKTAATESDASMSAIIDLSPSSNGSTVDRDLQHKHVADDEDDDAKSQSVVATEDTKVAAALSNEAGVLESQSKETNGISSVKDNATNDTDCGDNVEDESACDSKIILKRVDKDAAKDDKQGEGEDLLETEDTKSKINSLRD